MQPSPVIITPKNVLNNAILKFIEILSPSDVGCASPMNYGKHSSVTPE